MLTDLQLKKHAGYLCCIHIHLLIHAEIYICWIHTDAMITDAVINDARRTSLTTYIPLHFIARVRKGCSRFACERVLETEHKLHILTPLLWPSRCVFLVLLDAQPEVLGSTPSGLFRGPPRSGVAFPTTSGLYCLEVCWQLLWHPTQLNYIIIQCPHDRPLDLWNRMFNRHQAEITVMQFRGYSLPVHHCSGTMGPSPCPIS